MSKNLLKYRERVIGATVREAQDLLAHYLNQCQTLDQDAPERKGLNSKIKMLRSYLRIEVRIADDMDVPHDTVTCRLIHEHAVDLLQHYWDQVNMYTAKKDEDPLAWARLMQYYVPRIVKIHTGIEDYNAEI